MPTSIAIAEDHRLVASALADLIRKFEHYELLYVAANGRELLKWIEQTKRLPDIALVDTLMPEMDGFETTAQLRQLYPSVRVLMLAMDDRQEHIDRIKESGAKGYLMKWSLQNELRQALEDMMRND